MKERIRVVIPLKEVAAGVGAKLTRPMDDLFRKAAHYLASKMVLYIGKEDKKDCK